MRLGETNTMSRKSPAIAIAAVAATMSMTAGAQPRANALRKRYEAFTGPVTSSGTYR